MPKMANYATYQQPASSIQFYDTTNSQNERIMFDMLM